MTGGEISVFGVSVLAKTGEDSIQAMRILRMLASPKLLSDATAELVFVHSVNPTLQLGPLFFHLAHFLVPVRHLIRVTRFQRL
jgi:hypothetical protein